MHPEPNILRSYLDGELTSEARAQTEQHLSQCASCRATLNEEETRRKQVRTALDSLAPQNEDSADRALVMFRRRRESTAADSGHPARWFRPAAAAIAATVVIVAALSIPTVRVWASSFLSLFRVQQINIVQVDPAGLKALQQDIFNSSMGPRFDQFFSDSVHTRTNGERRTVNTVEEAGRVAGFGVRLPGAAGRPTRIGVEPSVDISFDLDVSRLNSLLEEAGHGEIRLPESVNGRTVSAHIPASVAAFFGDCPAREQAEARRERRSYPNCRVLVQLPGPTVAAPADFDVVSLSATMMELLGMPPEQARKWSESVDWTSTLVVPIPRDSRMRISDIMVDGVSGTQIVVPGRHGDPQAFNILWVRDGILYTFLGQGRPEDALGILSTM